MKRKYKNSSRLTSPLIDFEKFKGKHLALVNNKIVAVGRTAEEVFHKARRLFPDKKSDEIVLFFVPKDRIFIYC